MQTATYHLQNTMPLLYIECLEQVDRRGRYVSQKRQKTNLRKSMTVRYILLLCSLWLSCLVLTAQETEETDATPTNWEALYKRADYQGAAEALQQEIHTLGATPERYYNLGVCYDRLKQPAYSLLSYERALWLDPTMSKARHNLRLGYAQMPISPSDGRAFAILDDFCYALSKQALMSIGIVLTILFVVGLIIFRLGGTVLIRQIAFYSALGLLMLWLLIGAMIAHHWYYHKVGETRAIIIEGTSLKASPSSAETTLELPAGSPLKLEGHEGEWARVTLYDGQEGYVLSRTVESVVAQGL